MLPYKHAWLVFSYAGIRRMLEIWYMEIPEYVLEAADVGDFSHRLEELVGIIIIYCDFLLAEDYSSLYYTDSEAPWRINIGYFEKAILFHSEEEAILAYLGLK